MATTNDNEVSTTNSPETPAKESFSDAVRRAVRPRDVIADLFPAALFFGVGLLPPAMREQLAFSTADPNVLTALTSNLAHADNTHLLRNLTAYLIVVPTAYLLSVLADRRQLLIPILLSSLPCSRSYSRG